MHGQARRADARGQGPEPDTAPGDDGVAGQDATGRAALRAKYTKRRALLSGADPRYRFNAQI